jgi:hypothetical protein
VSLNDGLTRMRMEDLTVLRNYKACTPLGNKAALGL